MKHKTIDTVAVGLLALLCICIKTGVAADRTPAAARAEAASNLLSKEFPLGSVRRVPSQKVKALPEEFFVYQHRKEGVLLVRKDGRLLLVTEKGIADFKAGESTELEVAVLQNGSDRSTEETLSKLAMSPTELVAELSRLELAIKAKNWLGQERGALLESWLRSALLQASGAFENAGSRIESQRLTLLLKRAEVLLLIEDFKGLSALQGEVLGAECSVGRLALQGAAEQRTLGDYLTLIIGVSKSDGDVAKGLQIATRCEKSLSPYPIVLAYTRSAAAQLLLSEQRTTEALAMYTRVVEAAPKERIAAAAYYWLALDLAAQEKREEALGGLHLLQELLAEPIDEYEVGLRERAELLAAELRS